MDYVNLGRSGLKVSRLCLGMMTYGSPQWRPWVLSEDEGRPFIRRALDLGINFFDTADMYSLGASEEILGRALRDFVPRHEVVVATKVYFPMGDKPNQSGLSRVHILHAIDASLHRLGMDFVDLYQIHRWDYETPIEETLEALDDVVRAGKARYIGASSMFAWQLSRALHLSEQHGWPRFVAMQNHYNLVYREEEREMLPLCRAEGLGVIPWSPLARGMLTGSRRRGEPASTIRARTDDYAQSMYDEGADFDVVDRVLALAERRKVRPAQIALAWLLAQDGITAPIIGASQITHLDEAVGALDLKLSPEEAASLEAPYRPHPVLGHD
jgi:aryl-alcohol dehydrogenase-like predicted oxidoreductase